MIFVDTSAWYATWVGTDPNHEAAKAFASFARERFVTTDYVIDEFLTLLRVRGEHRRAQLAAERVIAGTLSQIEWVRPDDVLKGANIFHSYRDKLWSFTDCVSLVVMQRLQTDRAFAFDEHCRQFGAISILPST